MSSRSYARFTLPVEVLPFALRVGHMEERAFDNELDLTLLFEEAGREALDSKSPFDDFEEVGKHATINSYERGGGYDIGLVFEKVGIPYTLDADAASEGNEYPAFIRLHNANGEVFDRIVSENGTYAISVDVHGESPTFKPMPGELEAVEAHARENVRLTKSIEEGGEAVRGIASMYLAWKSEK